MKFGFWNFYNFANQNRMFMESDSPVGNEWRHPTICLKKRLEQMGHHAATLDMDDLTAFDHIFFFDHPTLFNRFFRRLLRMKHPSINLIATEPPIVRPDNYDPQLHKSFRKVLTWKKALHERNPGKYILYHLPNRLQVNDSLIPFQKRKLCVLINSFMISRHPRELYSERIRAIRWFESNAPGDFDLIGTEWDKPLFTGRLAALNFPLRFLYRRLSFCRRLKTNKYPSFIGPNTKSKHSTLQDYRFSIAYENSCEPDYLSEKIFDCLSSGCVPVYLGAPNVQDYIPRDAFIDKRDFRTYAELHKYLSTMSETEYRKYVEAAQRFAANRAAYPFTSEAYAQTFIDNFT